MKDAIVFGVIYNVYLWGQKPSGFFFRVKGANLAMSQEKIESFWKGYPNFTNEGDTIYYYVSPVEIRDLQRETATLSHYNDQLIVAEKGSHRGLVEASYYNGELTSLEVHSKSNSVYSYFQTEEQILERIENDKALSISVSEKYKSISDYYFWNGYLKATVIEDKRTIYYESDNYSDEVEGYVVKDKNGNEYAVFGSVVDLPFKLEIGKEYEFWGMILPYYSLEDGSPIVTIETWYVDLEGIEIYNLYNISK